MSISSSKITGTIGSKKIKGTNVIIRGEKRYWNREYYKNKNRRIN